MGGMLQQAAEWPPVAFMDDMMDGAVLKDLVVLALAFVAGDGERRALPHDGC